MRTLLRLIAPCLLLILPLTAQVTTFYGIDPGVGPGQAAPNSIAAATAFANGVGVAGFTTHLIDFEGLPTGSFTSLDAGGGVTITLTNNDSGAGILNTSGSAVLGYNTTPGGAKYLRVVPIFGTPTAIATFSFATPIQAFGANITGLETFSGVLHVIFMDGTNQDLPVAGSNGGGRLFFGFSDPGLVAISSVVLELEGVTSSLRDVFAVDDVSFTDAAPDLFFLWFFFS